MCWGQTNSWHIQELWEHREHGLQLLGGSAEPFTLGWEKGGTPDRHHHHTPASPAVIPLITTELIPSGSWDHILLRLSLLRRWR